MVRGQGSLRGIGCQGSLPQEVVVNSATVRIVSLLPGATETLFALGLGDQLVGVTHECDHPPAARSLPRVTRSTLDLDGLEGGQIEAAVAAAVREGRPLYEIDATRIEELRPDLVVAQDV